MNVEITETWEFFDFIAHAISKEKLKRLFGVSYTQFRRYCRAPEVFSSEDYQQDPALRVLNTIKCLVSDNTKEGKQASKALVLLFASAVGCGLEEITSVTPMGHAEKECLHDYSYIVRLHELICNNESQHKVLQQWQKVRNQLDRTVAAYNLKKEQEQEFQKTLSKLSG